MALLRAKQRFERGSLALLVLGASLLGGFAACSGDPEVAQKPGIGGSGGTGGSDAGVCFSGQFRCEGNVARRCESSGQLGEAVDCKNNGGICTDLLGCVACVPGKQSC